MLATCASHVRHLFESGLACHPHVDEHLGEGLVGRGQFGQGAARFRHDLNHSNRGNDAVADVGVLVAEDDVP